MIDGKPKREVWEPEERHRALVRSAAEAFGYTALDAVTRCKRAPLARMRHGVIFVLRHACPELSFPDIAQLLARSCHSSICHGLKQANRLRQTDSEFRAITDALVAGNPPLAKSEAAVPTKPKRAATPGVRLTREEIALANLKYDIETACDDRRPGKRVGHYGTTHSQGKLPIPNSEIESRRAAHEEEVARRQLAHLEAERVKYGLPRRGKALVEMVV